MKRPQRKLLSLKNLLKNGNYNSSPRSFVLSSLRPFVEVNPRYFRPTEVELLIGDPTKANTKLGWKPEYDLKALVKDMMESDLELMKKDTYLKEGGFKTLNYYE